VGHAIEFIGGGDEFHGSNEHLVPDDLNHSFF